MLSTMCATGFWEQLSVVTVFLTAKNQRSIAKAEAYNSKYLQVIWKQDGWLSRQTSLNCRKENHV